MPDVFVSYSRRDGDFVRWLVADLETRGKSVWLDTEGIEDAAVFPEAIRKAIEGSDAFVFVVTPESAASQYCEQEVAHAVALKKRLVPVLRLPVPDDGLPEAIRVRNWIPFTVEVDQGAASERLVAALDTDLEHAHAHTYWLVKALAWDAKERDQSVLLRGSELAAAETWLAGAAETADPAPVPLQRAYLLASRRASAHRQRLMVGASLTAVVVAAALAVAALISRGQAQTSRAIAQSRALAAESTVQLSTNPERSILLAIAAEEAHRTPEAAYALRVAIDNSPIRQRLPSIGDQSFGNGFGPNVAFSPDGTQIAEGSWRGTIQLLDAATTNVRRRINVGQHAPWVAYSPDGATLAVGADSGVALLDPRTGKRRGTIGALRSVVGLTFSADGRRLAAISSPDASATGSKLVVWGMRTHTSRSIPLGQVGETAGQHEPLSVGFSPDGHRVVVGAVNGLGVFDVGTGRLLASALTGEQTTHAEYSPDGSLIAATRKSRPTATMKMFRVDLLDSRTLERRATIFRSNDASEIVRWTTFSPDGSRVAYVAGDVFGIYSVPAHRLLYQTGVDAPYLAGAGFSADGQRFAVLAGDGSGAVYSAGGAAEQVIDSGGINSTMIGNPLALARNRVVSAFSPIRGPNAGREIVQAWRLNGTPIGKQLVISRGNCPLVGVAPQARFAYTAHGRRDCAGDQDLSVHIWDLDRRRQVATFNPSAVSSLTPPALDRSGSRMVEQLDDGAGHGDIDLSNTRSGETTFVGSSTCVFSAQAVSDDGRLMAAFDRCPPRLITWTLTAKGRIRHQLPVSVVTATGPMRFSPDAKHIAIANVSGRGNIAIVDTADGRTTATLTGHSDRIVDLAYSPDGKLLVTASRDGTARVWDTDTGHPLRTFEHPDPLFGVAFSPGGRTIATMDTEGIIRLWDACTDCRSPSLLLALAKSRVTRQLTPAEHRTYFGG